MNLKIPHKDYLRVKVIPKSAQNEIVEILEDGNGEQTIKIRIKAAPEKGKANAELLKFLSKQLKIAQANLSIIAGKTDTLKLIKVKNESH